MSFPTDGNEVGKLAGSQVLSNADAGLLTTLAASSTSTGTPFSTGIPATVVVLGQVASGTVTCVINTGASSGVMTQAASGTLGSTALSAVTANTSTSKLFASVDVTADPAYGNITFSGKTLAILVLYGMTAGENWHSAKQGYQACASTLRGDGSGVLNLGPQ